MAIMTMAQIPMADTLKPATPALTGEGVLEAEMVAEGALLTEALAVTRVTEAETGTEETEGRAVERAVLLTGIEEEAVGITETKD